MHYALVGQARPGGSAYPNDFAGWSWLKAAAKAARWLGYVPFGAIVDERNAEPVIRIAPRDPVYYIWRYDPSGEPELPSAEFYAPTARIDVLDEYLPSRPQLGQPYRLAVIGEKSSLEPVLGPVANSFGADLYLPSGEISDTYIYRLADAAHRDGRPLVVSYFADCDPGGWQMAISVSRKLQAFRELLGGPEFEVHRVALTPIRSASLACRPPR